MQRHHRIEMENNGLHREYALPRGIGGTVNGFQPPALRIPRAAQRLVDTIQHGPFDRLHTSTRIRQPGTHRRLRRQVEHLANHSPQPEIPVHFHEPEHITVQLIGLVAIHRSIALRTADTDHPGPLGKRSMRTHDLAAHRVIAIFWESSQLREVGHEQIAHLNHYSRIVLCGCQYLELLPQPGNRLVPNTLVHERIAATIHRRIVAHVKDI